MLEKNKRKLKSQEQVDALENIYEEIRYPSDSIKLELSRRTGLTEKQVCGWFCHRRLKDKKLFQHEEETAAAAHGKQDRSSGVIQDSCGSTKVGDNNRQLEVESRRSCSKQKTETDDDDDNDEQKGFSSSSETSSPPLRFSKNSLRGMRSRPGPSGYLKLKGNLENSAAVTAVKKQLGTHYRDDGPPLGIGFHPLPPGAFGSPLPDPPNLLSPYHPKAFAAGGKSTQPALKRDRKKDEGQKPGTLKPDVLPPPSSNDGSSRQKLLRVEAVAPTSTSTTDDDDDGGDGDDGDNDGDVIAGMSD